MAFAQCDTQPMHYNTFSAHYAHINHNHSQPYYATNPSPIAQANYSPSSLYPPRTESLRRKHSQNSLSFVPSTSHRSEQPDYSTMQPRRHADRAPVIISPFRSVRKMKRPFQLVLPTSPSFDHSPLGMNETRASRTPAGHHTLRTWRSDQNIKQSLETFGLLPSPPISESRASHPTPSSAYFSPRSESDFEQTNEADKPCYSPASSQDEACDTPSVDSPVQSHEKSEEVTNVHMAHSNMLQHESSDEMTEAVTTSEQSTSPIVSPPKDGSDKRSFSGSSQKGRTRAGTVSSETSNWKPSNLTYCETWLQGVPIETMDVKDEKSREANRRKFQIVQKSPPPHLSPKAPDEQVRLAVASKPKLVDISRQSSPAMGYSIPTQAQPVPSTPDQRQHEVSAFSPDTPLGMSDSGYATQFSCYSSDGYQDQCHDDKDEDEYTDSASVNSESVTSTVVCERSDSRTDWPFSPQKSDTHPSISEAPKPHASPGRSSHTSSEKELVQKLWDQEWTLDQLDHSVKDFPRSMLRLTSPVIMFLRETDERALLRPFRKIFPDVAENLLDCLCAVLIARNYIVSLASSHRKTSFSSNSSRLDVVPEKARTTLGIQPHASPDQIRDRVLRSIDLRQDLDGIVDKLLFAICGRSDETLKAAVTVLTQVLETKA